VGRTAFVIGGNGQIGRALAPRMARSGWDVTICHRGSHALPAELSAIAREALLDRDDDTALRDALAGGADVVVDIRGFGARDAAQLVALSDRIASIVSVSSASVYTDAQGRTLDEATDTDSFPRLPVPIAETNPTVPPGDATYSTRKVAMEQALLAGPVPTTVVRPCAIFGVGSEHPREWFFVKRILDGRRAFLHGFLGESRFHTTAVDNLAELIGLAAERPADRVLNCGDPDPPSVLEIARAIADALGAEPAHVLLPGPPPVGSPWTVPAPLLVDSSRATAELGYQPVTGYRDAVADVCAWLRARGSSDGWRDQFPVLAAYPEDLFDYAAEDDALRSLGAGSADRRTS
jgi:nucleoside-diphosphate-sugar epimerase